MRAVTYKELGILSDIIYIANSDIFSPSAWTEIIDLLRKLTPVDVLGAVFLDIRTCKPERHVSYNINPVFFERYANYYHARELTLLPALARNLHAWRPTDIVPKSVWENSEIYNDFLLPEGLCHAVTTALNTGQDVHARIYMARGKGNAPFSQKDVHFLSILQTHFVSALRRAKLFEEILRTKNTLEGAFDKAPMPIFIFDDSAKLIHINQMAESICGCINKQENLDRIVNAVSMLIKEQQLAEKICIPPRECICYIGNNAYRLGAYLFQASCCQRYYIVPAVSAMDYVRFAYNRAVNQYGLTHCEANICAMLIAGLSDRDIARRLNVDVEIAMVRVKSVLDRLRVSCVSELVDKLIGDIRPKVNN
ncbi:MAG: helix-turn-helix transcriptional regulator [Armatimonadota bacterium]|nr:helix-turn-helix transcriptional regulator [Armatimonadota bacterium]